jgi:hypothetical protein
MACFLVKLDDVGFEFVLFEISDIETFVSVKIALRVLVICHIGFL